MRPQHITHHLYGQPVLRLHIGADGTVSAPCGATIGRVQRDGRFWIPSNMDGSMDYPCETRTSALGVLVHRNLYRVRSIFDVWYPLAVESSDRADEARPLPFDAASEPESLDARLRRTDAMRADRAEQRRADADSLAGVTISTPFIEGDASAWRIERNGRLLGAVLSHPGLDGKVYAICNGSVSPDPCASKSEAVELLVSLDRMLDDVTR